MSTINEGWNVPYSVCGADCDVCLFLLSDADRREWVFKGGAFPGKDGAGWGSDGEGLAASPTEEPQSQHQLDRPSLRPYKFRKIRRKRFFFFFFKQWRLPFHEPPRDFRLTQIENAFLHTCRLFYVFHFGLWTIHTFAALRRIKKRTCVCLCETARGWDF